MNRADRENEIFEVLQEFKENSLDFIVVGGYGVSAYQHRFSVDADLVIKKQDLEKFTTLLEDQGFEKRSDVELDVYGGRYVAYVKDRELPVTIDLLVDKLKCRQTDASWNYNYFKQHSEPRTIQGSEKTVQVPVPEKELLIAVKLHSGRRTDVRDVVALAQEIDTDQVIEHLDRGDQEKLEDVLEEVDDDLGSEGFEDSFKGVFMQGTLPEEEIHLIHEIINNIL